MIIFCKKNYTIQKRVSLRVMVTQNGYWNKHMILLKPATGTNKINNNNDMTINNLSDKIVHTLKPLYKDNHVLIQ